MPGGFQCSIGVPPPYKTLSSMQPDFALQPGPRPRFDFAAGVLKRLGRVVELDSNLPRWIVEAFFRRRRLSTAESLLLPRKQSGQRNGETLPSAALSHELTDVRYFIDLANLPIQFVFEDDWCRVEMDRSALECNIWDAQDLADEAQARLDARDLVGTLELSKQALSVDPDGLKAADLIVKVLGLNQDLFDCRIVAMAELSIARQIVPLMAAIQRLTACPRRDPVRMKAKDLADGFLIRLQRRWHALQSWPFGNSPSETPGYDIRRAVREIVAVAIETRRGDAVAAFERFRTSPLVLEIIDDLLDSFDGSIGKAGSKKRTEIVQCLATEILARLLLSDWRPAVTLCAHDFRDDILTFVKRRRIDWKKVLNRAETRGVEFRDEVLEHGRSSEQDE